VSGATAYIPSGFMSTNCRTPAASMIVGGE
jgi:hypothetical protein